jgi:hypothetical protein
MGLWGLLSLKLKDECVYAFEDGQPSGMVEKVLRIDGIYFGGELDERVNGTVFGVLLVGVHCC